MPTTILTKDGQNVDNTNPFPVYQSNAGTIDNTITSLITTTGTQINIPGNGERKIILTNIGFANSGNVDLCRTILGPSTINAAMLSAGSGYPLNSGSSLTLEVYNPTPSIYGVAASGGVRILATVIS